MLREWQLAARLLMRECRAGQWLIVFFALVLAVTTITGINFFTNRLAAGLDQQAAKVLGGDLVVSSSIPIPAPWQEKAKNLKLRTAEVITFPSVISRDHQLQLVTVKAVSETYPLHGTPNILAKHRVLAEYRLLSLLSLQLGTQLDIGAAKFKMSGILPSELDMMNTGWAIAPRVLMRIADVPDTQVLLPGSRVIYQLLVVGDKNQVSTFNTWLTPQLKPGQTLTDIQHQRDSMLNMLQHADKYIQLVVLFCLLMCGTAITLSVRQHLHRHYEDVALWRCLGAPEKQVTHVLFIQLLIIAFAAGIAGSVAGYYLQNLIAQSLHAFIELDLPPASFMPAILGFATSTILLFCYAYPVISILPRTSPLYLWRHETRGQPKHKYLYAIITIILLLGYVYWMMDFSLLALFILDSLLLSIGVLYVVNILTLSFIKKLVGISNGIVRRGLSQFIQHPETASIQLAAFTLVLTSVFILGTIKHNLLGQWQSTLPPQTPNYFAFNIAPAELDNVQKYFRQQGITLSDIYPMVRGRLTALNNKPIMLAIPPHAEEHNALHRDLNFSSMLTYPSDNQIVTGARLDHRADGKALISVENSLATELGFKLGDELSFQIGGQEIKAKIANFRSVNWGSFHPNFYIIFPPHTLDKFPTTYITSFHLQPGQATLLNQLIRDYPNITVIDIASTLQQIQNLLTSIANALQYLFNFAICAAVLIFITNLAASMDERRETYKLLRILGASRNYIVGSLIVEFSFLAILTVLFAYTFAKVISQLLITIIF